MWKNFETTFKQILDNLKTHRGLIKEQATLISFQRQELFIEQYKRDVEDRSRSLEKQQEEEQWKKYVEILEWFSASKSTEADHAIFQEARSPETGEWILEDEKVQNWLELDVPQSSIIWINGIPGAGQSYPIDPFASFLRLMHVSFLRLMERRTNFSGKTILASVIIDGSIARNTDGTTYFYCKENDDERNTCISIYRGILKQLLSKHRDLVPYYWDKMVSTGETVLSTTHLAEGLLRTMLEKVESCTVIIDGLDECNSDQRKLLLAFFSDIVGLCDEKEPGKLRVMFLSQDYVDIQKALQTSTCLRLTEEDNKADIKTYVRACTSLIHEKFELDSSTAKDIEESICGHARGMYDCTLTILGRRINWYRDVSFREACPETSR